MGIKLNNKEDYPNRGEAGYNLDCKYDMIWDIIIHNTNEMSKKGELGMC